MTTAPLASKTLGQLKTEVQYQTGDVGGTRYSPEMLTDAINFAIKQTCRLKGYTYVEEPIGVSVGTPPQKYPLSGTQFSSGATTDAYDFRDYLEIRRVFLGGTVSTDIAPFGKELLSSSVASEGLKNPEWRTSTGTPTRWMLVSGDQIGVSKNPASGNVTGDPTKHIITVGYVQQPRLLVADADAVDSRIPLAVQAYLKYAASGWLLSLDQSDTTSLVTSQTYLETFNRFLGV